SKADIVQRFEREAQAAGRIGSQHIVEVLDLGNLPSGERFMVMEYLDGEPLTSRIKVRGRMSPHDLAPLLRQLLDGLSSAHAAGIIHRDLKPDNVYVVKRGGQDFVKILDFGVSKFSGADSEFSMTRTGAVMGTPYYMSPEQARGQQIDQRSDLYSIGVVAYQAVTGRVPFNAETFNELIFKIALEAPEPIENVVPGFDPGFAAIIKKAMTREPQNRFSTAQEFMHAIDAWRAGAPMPHGYAPHAMPSHPGQHGHHQGSGAFSNSGLSTSGMGMSGGNLGVSASLGQSGSNPALSPSTGGFSQSGQNAAFGRSGANHPMGTSGAPVQAPPMGQSQVGLSVTTRETKRTPIVAAVAIMAVLGIGGGLAAFKFAGAGSAGAATQTTGTPATETAKPETTAAETAKPETPPAETAKPEATTAPTAEATTEATAEPTAAPVAQNPGRPTRPGPGPKPTQPTSKPVTQPSTGSGRSIGTDL
ncbi:MAG: serine/threonine protein kinase, partial [Polyangiaceae bacterium]|nr:serine/threonine protein kinase [Polyangiaceae bacterium]